MIEAILTIPLEVRLAIVFGVGLGLGALANLGIYRLAWDKRSISPWSPRAPHAPPRRWSDYLPVIGWLGLSREAKLHGAGFWIRPPLIEIATAVGLTILYSWEVHGDLVPWWPGFLLTDPAQQAMYHARFVSHGLLIVLMIVATFIDFDEQTIPDWITVPGALTGLALAFAWPMSLPTSLHFGPPPQFAASLDLLWLSAPLDWPPALHGGRGLALGLFCYLGWCFALQPKLWTLRRGWVKAFVYLCASMKRDRYWWIAPSLAIAGTALIVVAWQFSHDTPRWQGLLTSLVGMAFGGALLWAIRAIGSSAMGQEAMGFGDVTLMAMIGAFVGWQGSLVAFFIAPFAALLIALAQYFLTRRRDLAFGPYLCAGALGTLLRWPEMWELRLRGVFELGLLVPAMLGFGLILMWLLLVMLVMLRRSLGG